MLLPTLSAKLGGVVNSDDSVKVAQSLQASPTSLFGHGLPSSKQRAKRHLLLVWVEVGCGVFVCSFVSVEVLHILHPY